MIVCTSESGLNNVVATNASIVMQWRDRHGIEVGEWKPLRGYFDVDKVLNFVFPIWNGLIHNGLY